MTQPTAWGVPRIADAPVDMETYADRDDDCLDALLDAHSGAARPAYAVAGTVWHDSAAGAWMLFDGAADHRVATAGAVASHAADHVLTAADLWGGTVLIGDAADLTLTVPADATEALPAGVPVRVIRSDVGAVTVAAEAGATLSAAGGLTAIAAQWSAVTLVKTGPDAWILFGDLV